MAGIKEIRNRIAGIQETRKITNAMYLIASTKMRKARVELERTKPYFNSVQREIKRIFRNTEDIDSPYFYPEDGSRTLDGTYAYLVVTADKGLAGAYNHNVLKEAERLIADHPDCLLYVVGEYGRQYFRSKGIPIQQSFLYTAQNPTFHRAREIGGILLEQFDAGAVEKIYIVYSDFRSGMAYTANTSRLLPFHHSQITAPPEEIPADTPFELFPSAEAVLEGIVPSYIEGFIFSALIDSFCCEQSARMTAMESANRSADKLLQEMQVQYNHLRQSAITQEITEICAAAKYQQQRRIRRIEERNANVHR